MVDVNWPAPHALRRVAAELADPPSDFEPDAPDWARRLSYAHSNDLVDMERLRPFVWAGDATTQEQGLTLAYDGVRLALLPGGQAVSAASRGATPSAGEWMYRRLTDYWDARVAAIEAAGECLEGLEAGKLEATLREIQACVAEHCRVLSDEDLIRTAISFADDLYKQANTISVWGDSYADYLRASGMTFCGKLADRGFRVQYLVSNSWNDPQRLFELLPEWYEAAGFVFTCPLGSFSTLIEGHAMTLEQAVSERPEQLLAEGRQGANMVAERCQEQNRHLVHLETDDVEGSFEAASECQKKPGVLTIFRSDAPEPGSKISVVTPTGVRHPSPGPTE